MKNFRLMSYKTYCRLALPHLTDRRASVAIEFAIVLPILVILLIGLIEFRTGFLVKQRTIVAATTMSNIVAETEELTIETTSNLKKVAETILYPHSPETLDVSVAVVTYNGVALTILWQESTDGEPFPPDVADEMLAGLLMTSETAIISNVKVAHEPYFGGRLFDNFEFESRNVVYPDSPVSFDSSEAGTSLFSS